LLEGNKRPDVPLVDTVYKKAARENDFQHDLGL
jgi:hypothetical protein